MNWIKYTFFLVGLILLIFDELKNEDHSFMSIAGFLLLIIGLYMISKEIGDKPVYNPYAVKSYEEEE